MSHDVAIGSLFSGIGGLDLGLECALRDGGFNVSTVWQCEADAWCRGILARHWPRAVRYDDVRAVGPDAPRVDVLCGGFPCQDVSYAGKGAGLAGERSGLWFEFARIVRDLRPRVVVVENVAALAARGLDAVLGSLSEAGYDALWFSLRASDVGAPHQRERVFFVGWRVGDAKSGVECGSAGGTGTTGAHQRGRVTVCASEADVGSPLRVPAQHEREPRIVPHETREAQAGAQERERRGNAADGASAADMGNPSRNLRRSSWDDGHGASDGASQEYPANARGARLERHGDSTLGTRAQHARSRSACGRSPESRLGRAADGLPARLDAHTFPARPHEPQHPSEAPRITQEKEDRNVRLKALGNAVVPQCGYVVGCVVAEVLRGGVA